MNLPASFCFFLSVFGPCLVLNILQCPRYSVQEFYYSDILPEVRSSLLEMRMYFDKMFDKLESNILALVPDLEHDQEKRSNYTYNLFTVKDFVDRRVIQAGFEVDTAWGKLFGISSSFLEDPQTSITEEDLLLVFKSIEKAHDTANSLLDAGTREFVLFYEAMISDALEGVSRMIEDELRETPVDDYEVARLLKEKIRKVAPGNFLGIIIARILDRGMNASNRKPKDPVYLNLINSRVNEVSGNFTTFVEQRQHFTPLDWQEFWESSVRYSISQMDNRSFNTAENLGKMYKNEVYLAEIIMNLMTHY